MENTINFQVDLFNKISKAKVNFKKSPRERLTKEYIEGRLESVDQLWFEFLAGHKNLWRSHPSQDLNATEYIKLELYDKCEETYSDYKCELKTMLSRFDNPKKAQSTSIPVSGQSQNVSSNLKLPKIQIPTFSGLYTEWCPFRDMFQSLIGNNSCLDNIQKLHYLKGYLIGEAEQLIGHVPIEDSNYERCWKLLEDRYNNKKYISQNVLKRLFSQKNLTSESASGLKELVNTTNDCLASLKNIGIDVNNWDILIIHILSLKLDPETRRQWEFNVTTSISVNDLPSYKQFEEFLTHRFRAVEFLDPKTMTGYKSQTNKLKSLHVTNDTVLSCPACSDGHKLSQCKKFHSETVDDRRKFVLNNKVCFNCLGSNHSAKECRSNLRCRICKRTHHSLLHPTGSGSNANTPESNHGGRVASSSDKVGTLSASSDAGQQTSGVVSCFATGKGQQQVLLATAIVMAKARNGKRYSIRALLDQGSQGSFITEATVQYLGLKKSAATNQVTGLGGDKNIVSKSMVTIDIQSRVDPNFRIPVKAYVLNNITSLLPSKRVEAIQWEEFSVALADPQYYIPNKIQILLGSEVYGQILQEGFKRGPPGTPIAQATSLGWILSGIINSTGEVSSSVNVLHCCANEDNELLKKFWELEADVPPPREVMFTEDEKRCEDHFAETTRRDEEGRYVVRLPFRNGIPEVTGSKEIAEKRLRSLEQKLNKDADLKQKYSEVINEYLELGHMEEVPENEVNNPNAIYLPHHAVVRQDKDTTKVRVVFDASCKGKNDCSLNDHLLVGPTLQPDLRHIMTQWRESAICLSADVVKMYRQVKVDSQDADYQRILWKDEKTQELKHYRLTRVTFGTASAPYLAVKALQQVAQDHSVKYPSASEKTLKYFYVDDLMTGVQNQEEGRKLYKEMNELLAKGGFNLQKWTSNNERLLEEMKDSEEERIQKGKEIGEGLKIKTDEIMKIVGLTWNRSEDSFRYQVDTMDVQEPATKRKIISDISRFYDPLGWVSPSIIIAKMIIQKLWLAGLGWDDPVPTNILNEWKAYKAELKLLSNACIPRWIGLRAGNFIELHGFSDASKEAYAAVVYSRVIDANGQIHVSLISSKTKVAPVKQVSIPRLELCGAVLLTRLLMDLAVTMNIEKSHLHAWTDSTVVLAWLNSHPSRWKVFVANRVSEIITNLNSHHWSHVSTKCNPADAASRGQRPSELVSNDIWFNGPQFLHNDTIEYKKPKETNIEVEEENIKAHCATTQEEEPITKRFSSLVRMIRVLAYCKRFAHNAKTIKQERQVGFLTTYELQNALNCCIINCQLDNFKDEILIIKTGRDLPKCSSLRALNPFLDRNGVLRVGGRLEHSQLNENRKHPILIPKESHLTTLIIADAHKHTLHGGPQLMLTYLWSKYWILGAKQLVKAHYRKCVTCAKVAAASKTPLQGQAPPARVTPARPFSHSGVDFAGPIQIRTTKGRGHKSYKGYICLFVCMATRAIHLEVVSDLTSEGFMQAFKRFQARRGHCSHIWSDNGTNFIGAAAELKRCTVAEETSMLKEVAEALATLGCEWHFIPPHSPNFGGLWEAGVKSVKYHLKRIVANTTLTYEEMATVLAQVEACLNSRPMSSIMEESNNYTILTPGHFLIGEPPVAAPDYNFEEHNISSLRRWQHAQRMVQTFWRQWSQEYLTKFLHRYKFSTHTPPPNLGDVVVVKEDNMPPCRWLFGKIIAIHPGADNIVRVITVKTKNGSLKRPLSKICILPVASE